MQDKVELFDLSLSDKKEVINRGNQMIDCLKGLDIKMTIASLVVLIDTFKKTYNIDLREIDTSYEPINKDNPNLKDLTPIQAIKKLKDYGVASS